MFCEKNNTEAQEEENGTLNSVITIFDGQPPDQLVCDTTLRKMPDESWVMIMLGGGHTEPLPQNRLLLSRSTDEGKTWPSFARKTDIPNPGSKATLYGLGGDTVALLHNPNPAQRSPLALWVSYDGLKTWPYRRILIPESCDGPSGQLNYPDGFVSQDGKYLNFAFDDNRHRAVYVQAELPGVTG